MQLDQTRNVANGVVVETQCLHPLFGQFCADQIVLVKGHATTRLEPTGRGFADVVQQCGEAQHQIALEVIVGLI